MRLVTFVTAAGPGRPRFGVLDGEGAVDTAAVLEPGPVLAADARARAGSESAGERAERVPEEMVAFFESGEAGLRAAERALALARRYRERGDAAALVDERGRPVVHEPGTVRLLAPVPRPRRIRDYLTYSQHAAGSGLELPAAFRSMPICYKCNVETVIGPEQPLLWPSYTEQLDFELELGFFTSCGGRDLSPAEARRCIAGVTIFNDVSARDIQLFEMSMGIGPSKGKDFCTSMGPCVLTMDQVDEWAVELTARVNGETWASGSTEQRQFSMAEVLAWASLDEEVHPGEFLALGTVGGGCGLELDRWIEPGDVVELEASGLGVLRNPVGERSKAPAGAGLPGYTGAPAVHVQPARHG